MSAKEEALDQVAARSEEYRGVQSRLKSARALFLSDISAAYDEDATQLEIAKRTGYSRQRIAQFLKEAQNISP